MAKKVICFALGGHIANQNASFEELKHLLPEYEFYGAVNGFEAFKTTERQNLNEYKIKSNLAGCVFGSGRHSLTNKNGEIDDEKAQRAIRYFKEWGFDIAVGSGGDDHGMQMNLLEKILKESKGEIGKDVDVFVLNKTMDNDLGGPEALTDFTNGFHTAIKTSVDDIRQHFNGAWTNNLPYIVGLFGRETNWVGATAAYFGNADRFIYGELSEQHPGHSIEKIHDLIVESQDENEKIYGKRFAMIIVPEGTRISGIKHADSSIIDEHGHHKLNPAVLVSELKKNLERKFGLKTHDPAITYEMRNFAPTKKDLEYGRMSAGVIAEAIRQGASGYESVFKIQDGEITADIDLIEKVSQKRYVEDYKIKPIIDKENFKVSDEIGRYYKPLFGNKIPLEEWIHDKPIIERLK
ncbi:MAG TPA: 6-phosphofructokinase [Candidatus Paceibacterota bacterium]|nr:6-phosphofructokinase [Candidatus Paceibacterota bacterium]